ncbi:MAG: hypothetical protein AB8G99_26655 [Planctomycetaceae bacterium]
MPGWHKQISDLVEDGKVAMVGIIQEQHPDRCRLFAQWQGFKWPILHDPMNIIPTRAVPLVIAIDEHGVVQSRRPRPDWVRNEFLKTDYPAPGDIKPSQGSYVAPPSENEIASPKAELLWGAAKYRSAKPENKMSASAFVDKAIAAYDKAVEQNPDDGPAHFGRGVALRMRYESPRRRPTDFQDAVAAWDRALEIDPNQYIYRRRIQQYGPRLMKPYPFYDWVVKARTEIKARGEEPIALAIEPEGAEIATPSRVFKTTDAKNPDPAGKINRDKKKLIEISNVTVPAKVKAGQTARVHVDLRPSKNGKWNNEASPVQVWMNTPDGWELERPLFELKQPPQAESMEARRLEFEVKLPKSAKSTTLTGYVLYYVCESDDGTCLYLRQDISVPIAVR